VEFKDKLKEVRQQRTLTQEQLAQRAGISLGNVRNYEQGLRQPSWAAVVKLSRALGVSADTFSACVPNSETESAEESKPPPATPSTPPAADPEAERKAVGRKRK
jgi:transcriptional regulator with XRE-family HTH domain